MFVKDKELQKKKHTHVSHILSLLDVALIRRYWKSVLRLEGIVQDVQEANSRSSIAGTQCYVIYLFSFLCCSMYCLFCVVLCIVCFVSFRVLFVCIFVLYYCHRLATKFQLNISYHIIPYFRPSAGALNYVDLRRVLHASQST